MKKNLTRILTFIIIAALICCLIPAFSKRVETEKENKNVVVSLYYNDIANRLRGEKLEDAIAEFKNTGVTTISFSEENLNSMVARGDITNIKYNVLRHKYDDESLELANLIAKEAPEIIYDSQLIITKDKEMADFLSETLPQRFTEGKDFKKVVHNNESTGIDTTVFCIFDGTFPTSDVQLGYNEKAIKKYSDEGFDICLIMRFSDSNETSYIDNIARMADEYNIKHINIRSATVKPENEADAKEHYNAISELISEKNLNLVVTENPNQLSNEAPFGYDSIFADNNARVMRSYETYDASQAVGDKTHYMFRYHQYLNSTIDRNIRFITVSQIHLSYTTYEKCTEYTIKAISEYVNKIKELGYTVNGDVPTLEYDVDLRPINAIATAIMVLMVYLIFIEIFGLKHKLIFPVALILSVLGAAVAFLMPEQYRWMFPTAWAVLAPCFTMTYVLIFANNFKDKIKTVPLAIITTALLVGMMSIFGIVQSSLLSGINYYVNNDIFRGIKLSLFIPLIFAVVVFVILTVRIDVKKLLSKIASFKIGDIKLVWVIVLLAIFLVAYKILSIYIVRSGNVNSISSLESWMRNLITEIFEARPRTKEFLVGYPCLILFVYYFRKTNIKLIQCGLFCGAAITAASISNSFCHVFTTVETIYGRVLNGVIIATAICIAIYIANIIFVKVVSVLFDKYVLPHIEKKESIYSLYKLIIGERN